MTAIFMAATVQELSDALAALPPDARFEQVFPGNEGVIVLMARTGDVLHMITVRDQRFVEVEEGEIVHAHGDQDFHGHSFLDYRDHEHVEDERLPPF